MLYFIEFDCISFNGQWYMLYITKKVKIIFLILYKCYRTVNLKINKNYETFSSY